MPKSYMIPCQTKLGQPIILYDICLNIVQGDFCL